MALKHLSSAAALLAVVALTPPAVFAGDAGEKAGGVVEESAKTGGHAIRDGVLTFGRTVRDFFTGGPRAAKETWRENADQTKANARQGGRNVREEADR